MCGMKFASSENLLNHSKELHQSGDQHLKSHDSDCASELHSDLQLTGNSSSVDVTQSTIQIDSELPTDIVCNKNNSCEMIVNESISTLNKDMQSTYNISGNVRKTSNTNNTSDFHCQNISTNVPVDCKENGENQSEFERLVTQSACNEIPASEPVNSVVEMDASNDLHAENESLSSINTVVIQADEQCDAVEDGEKHSYGTDNNNESVFEIQVLEEGAFISDLADEVVSSYVSSEMTILSTETETDRLPEKMDTAD